MIDTLKYKADNPIERREAVKPQMITICGRETELTPELLPTVLSIVKAQKCRYWTMIPPACLAFMEMVALFYLMCRNLYLFGMIQFGFGTLLCTYLIVFLFVNISCDKETVAKLKMFERRLQNQGIQAYR
jgi:hypothetical protein